MLGKKFYSQRFNNTTSYNTTAVSNSSSFRLNQLKNNIIKSNFTILPEKHASTYIKEKEVSILNCDKHNLFSKGSGCNIFRPVLNRRFTNDYILSKHCILPSFLQKPKMNIHSC